MKKFVLSAIAFLLPGFAAAGIVTGDSVSLEFDPGNLAFNGTAGAGADIVVNNFRFDVNGGFSDDIFSWTSIPLAGSLAGTNTFTLSSLAFTGGEVLAGFNLWYTALSGVTFSTTANSLTVGYTSTGFVGPGPILVGQYITRKVPEPATLALFGLGLAGLGLGLRRKKAA
jgi:hypothetical protein